MILVADAEIERRLGIAARLARCLEEPRAPRSLEMSAMVRAARRKSRPPRGTDVRFIVTNLTGAPRWLYEAIYCQRGQAENLIKAHKLHLASDRTSCSKATANQFRLLIHTAAYWLLHTLRGLAPKTSFWRDVQFDTFRLALIKSLPAGSTRGSRPGSPRWSPGSRSPCRRPTQTRRASSGSPPAPPGARPDRGGGLPPTEPVPCHPKPQPPALPAPPQGMPRFDTAIFVQLGR
jgi:hypothetical protein